MPEKNIFAKINNRYYQLTVSEKKIADYVAHQQQRVQYMSISELAEACDVAEATVTRFCRRLGLAGYNAFKLAVANASSGSIPPEDMHGDITEGDSVAEISAKLYTAQINAITQTRDLINADAVIAAADILCSAGKVLCMGQGGSGIMAQEAAHLFSNMLPGFFPVTDIHMQALYASGLTEKDAVLYFSYSGAVRSLSDVLDVVRDRGAKTILVTRFPKSPAAAYADVVLQCGSNESPLQHGSVAARTAQLYLLDVLGAEMYRRDAAARGEYREAAAEALSAMHI